MSEATTQDILIHTEAGVCTITFNRVEKKNSLTQAMYATLADTLGQVEADPPPAWWCSRATLPSSVPATTSATS